MEMLRTIVVALAFAGITVCTYYYLNSSQFPWEIANPGENVAQTSENPAGNSQNDPDQLTYAQDGPFAPMPPSLEDEDSLSLPGLDELPPAQGANSSEDPMVAASTAQLPTPPISDTDLPPLLDQQNPAPLDTNPAGPIQAQHQGQIGSNAIVDETQALPAPDDSTDLSIPAPPSLETNPGTDLPTPATIQGSSISNTNQGQGGMTNPLRQSTTPSTPMSQTPNIVPVPVTETPIQNSPAPIQAPAPAPAPAPTPASIPAPAPTPSQAQMEAEAEAETAAIREYLKIAKEKIQNGEALEVLRQLSKFYGNPRFTAEESSELVEILVLAATQVIYSQESLLDPAYTVQPGDTVEKIAAEYNIPPEFIMLVNGLQSGVPLQPGRQLKVIRGPFHVIVYLDRHEMILTLNGLFAGRFWIETGSNLIQKDSDFSFARKSVAPAGTAQMSSCDFILTSGESGSASLMKIQACENSTAIGTPTDAILMSPTDVQNLCAILGPKSQLLMRCHSLKPAPQQTASGANPATAPPQSVPAPAPGPASVPAPAPAYGSSAELPNSLPNTLPDSLPGTDPASAAPPAAEEVPFELPATL